ncbi:MAG: PepSY-associated TM helix domain-containing protein [Sphingomonas sp.]
MFGNPRAPDPRPAAIGNLDRTLADATRRAGEAPTFVAIENFGRADADITTFHPPRQGDIESTTLLYDGATGGFTRVKPPIGTRPSAGGTLTGIMAPLHFGNFAGLLSKAVWFALGFAMCYVTLTGLRLWLARRREGARALDWLDRSVAIVGFGLPFALVIAAAAFLIAMPQGTAVFWTTTAFLIASAVAIVGGFVAPARATVDRVLQLATGAAMLLLPPLRLLTGGPGWPTALRGGEPAIVAVDLALLVAGGWMTWRIMRGDAAPVVAHARMPAMADG